MGFSESFRFSERIRTLEMLLQLVICLRGEISCGNASLPDAFYGAAGRMNGKYREFLINAADRMKAGNGEKLSQICRECAEASLEKKLPYPWGKGRFFFYWKISWISGPGDAAATAFPVRKKSGGRDPVAERRGFRKKEIVQGVRRSRRTASCSAACVALQHIRETKSPVPGYVTGLNSCIQII